MTASTPLNSKKTVEDAPVSQASIAATLGISRSTVAAVLSKNKKVRISEETSRRVMELAGQLNYRPNRYAVVMRRGKTGLIGVMQDYGRLQSAHERQKFAHRSIAEAGYKVMGLVPSWFDGNLEEVENHFIESRVEGVLISGVYNLEGDGSFRNLHAAGIPYVVLSGRQIPGISFVRCNVRQSFQDLTKCLLKAGRRRLALLLRRRVGWELPGVNWAMEERVAGFTRAIEDAGGTVYTSQLPARPGTEEKREGAITGEVIVCDLEKPGSMVGYEIGKDAANLVLQRRELPDALMCSNDEWAVGALSSCYEHGVRVPTDMAVTGFDNSSEGPYCQPPLSTVAQPNELMARQAVNLLLQEVKEPGRNHQQSVYEWLGKILVRKSCGTGIAMG